MKCQKCGCRKLLVRYSEWGQVIQHGRGILPFLDNPETEYDFDLEIKQIEEVDCSTRAALAETKKDCQEHLDPGNPCLCTQCGHRGKVADFITPPDTIERDCWGQPC